MIAFRVDALSFLREVNGPPSGLYCQLAYQPWQPIARASVLYVACVLLSQGQTGGSESVCSLFDGPSRDAERRPWWP